MAEQTKSNEAAEGTEALKGGTTTEPVAKTRSVPDLPAGQPYIWGTGRRKKAIARVRIRPGSGKILVNERPFEEYFCRLKDRNAVLAPLKAVGLQKGYDVWCNVSGGGSTGQAGAITLGLARALSEHQPEIDHDLRDKGLLTRDSRMSERKKPGQPGARKRFQFSKR